MSIFVVVTSQQCLACKGIKMKDKLGTSFLDKIKEWVAPYTTQYVEVEMKHNGDLEGLKSHHPGLGSIVHHLPGFFIFTVNDWKNKSSKLPDTAFTGARKEKEIKDWAKAQSNKRTENFFTHTPTESPPKKEIIKPTETKLRETPASLPSAGSVSIKTISLYE